MNLTEAQQAAVVEMVATNITELIYKDILGELEELVGNGFGVPISFAERVTGWSNSWIRRNLPLVEAEGQTKLVSIGSIKEAWETRSTK